MILDRAFGLHADALLLRGRRARLLAENLANADTPNYKARDVDFRQLLQARMDPPMLTRTHAAHMSDGDKLFGAEPLYRTPQQSAIDGNTVDTQIEYAEFAKNALQYEASLRFLNGRISSIMQAIKGE